MFSVKHFALLIRSFSLQEMSFCKRIFSRSSDWIQGVSYYSKATSYRQNRQNLPFTGAQEPQEPIFHKQGHRFDEFSISHFSSLETECTKAAAFFKIGVLRNFAIFTVKHLCWSLFLIKQPPFRAATLLKGNSNTGVFL